MKKNYHWKWEKVDYFFLLDFTVGVRENFALLELTVFSTNVLRFSDQSRNCRVFYFLTENSQCQYYLKND